MACDPIPMLTLERDDSRRKLGRVLVMLCEWGREARRRQATSSDVAGSKESTSPQDTQDSQGTTALNKSVGS
jgi:hypothetical protein